MSQKIIIDTDPGIDDAMAVFLALQSPELEVIGLTTIFGNGTTELTTVNALHLLEIAGRTDIPVAKGADAPSVGKFDDPPVTVHGDDAQGNLHLPPPTATPHELKAANFIIQQVMAQPGEVTLLAVGPLTNLALALLIEPRLAQNVKEVVIMGGNALSIGNVTPAAEANIYKDPEAADVVFNTSWLVTMVGLDVTMKVLMTDEHIATIAQGSTPMARHLGRIVPFYRNFYRQYIPDGVFMHDPTALVYVLQPSLFRTEAWPIRVQLSGIGRGKTWPRVIEADRPGYAPWQDRPPINVCTGVNAKAALDLCVSRLVQ